MTCMILIHLKKVFEINDHGIVLPWNFFCTLKPSYSGHPLWRTPFCGGKFSQERMKCTSNLYVVDTF